MRCRHEALVQDVLGEYEETRDHVQGMERMVPTDYLEEVERIVVRIPDIDRDDDITK